MSRSLLLAGIVLAFSHAAGGAAPGGQRGVPVGRWTIEFTNGVKEVCDVRENGTTSVVELPRPTVDAGDSDARVKALRTSLGFAEMRNGTAVVVYQDDRVERWTRNGATMAVEHWATKAQFPAGPPVRGVGEQAAARGLHMTLSLERKQYRVDEPVSLDVIIENTGDAEAELGMSADNLSRFTFAVSYVGGGRSVGGIVPLTRYGAQMLQALDASKNVTIRLRAGERLRYRFALNRIVDMTPSGTYSIVLVRTLPPQDGRPVNPAAPGPAEVLVSNEVSVEMTEPPVAGR